jgi:hypothetical protein
LFDSMTPRQVDSAFQREAQAARDAGLDIALISYEDLIQEGDPDRAVRRVVQVPEGTSAIYRGGC